MSTGLVLEGGAMRGLYTAGVLDVFLENNVKAEGIVGVSAGVLFGVNYCSNQKGRTLRYNKKYVNDKRYMGLYSLLTTGNLVGRDFAFYELPTKLDIFDDDTFKNSGIDFYATVTNVNTGAPEYIQLKSVFEQMELLRATSALPFVSRLVYLDGVPYLDGGVSDSIPVDKCKELGFDKIIVVLTRPAEYRKHKSSPLPAKLRYFRFPRLAEAINTRYKRYNDTVEKIIDMENKKEIFVIRPSSALNIARVEKDPEKLQAVYDLGVEDAKRILPELLKYLKC